MEEQQQRFGFLSSSEGLGRVRTHTRGPSGAGRVERGGVDTLAVHSGTLAVEQSGTLGHSGSLAVLCGTLVPAGILELVAAEVKNSGTLTRRFDTRLHHSPGTENIY